MSKTTLRIILAGVVLAALGFLAYRALRPSGPTASVQFQAYQKLREASSTPLELSLQNGFPRGVVGRIRVPGETPAARAQAFLDAYKAFYLQSDPRLELHLRRTGGSEGEDVLFYQTYDGLTVYGAEFLVSLHRDEVFATAGGLLPGGLEIDLVPAIAPQDAEVIARTALGEPQDAPIFGVTELVIYEPSLISDSPRDPHLAWRVTVGDADPRVALIDAHDGTLLLQFSLVDEHSDDYDLDLEDANGNNAQNSSCYWDTTDDDQVGDEDELYDEADSQAASLYSYSWQTYTFYHTFGRHSYDNDDGQIEIYEHASVSNAQWIGADIDCDLIEFSNGYVAYDIFVHEFTHGVVDFTSNFSGAGQPGSLNEGYADIMATVADGNWTMGESISGGPIRSLSNPPAYTQAGVAQPDHMSEIYTGSADDYGEHINTGILSYAHYLIAAGGTHPDTGVTVQGLGMSSMGSLAYSTMVSLGSGSMFIDARNTAVGKAEAWWGGVTACQVRNAFYAVGLGNPDIGCNGTEDDPDPDGDGILFGKDNCPFLANPDQVDLDKDGIGSGCDFDDNANGTPDSYETALANPYNLCPTPGGPCDLDNWDGDNYVNDEDNCPWDVNNGQEDQDNDGEGDACDPDYDEDGWSNNNDDCPFTADPGQEDSDGDGAGDVCDPTPDCADVVAWSAGIGDPMGDGFLIEPHPISDPSKCPEDYRVDGSFLALDTGLSPGGGARQVEQDGGKPYAILPLPMCPPEEEGEFLDTLRGQLVLGGLDPSIRAWVARDDGMAVSNDRQMGADRILRFQPMGGYHYQLVLALFGVGEGEKTAFSILLDCGPKDELAVTPQAEATATVTPSATASPSPTPAPLAFADPRPSAPSFYYGRNTCGPMQITVETSLMGGDPQGGPYDVVMFFRLAEMNGPGRTDWTAVSMNPSGEMMFTKSLGSETDIPGFNMWTSSWLQVQFVADDAGGAEVARSPVFPTVSELARCPR